MIQSSELIYKTNSQYDVRSLRSSLKSADIRARTRSCDLLFVFVFYFLFLFKRNLVFLEFPFISIKLQLIN